MVNTINSHIRLHVIYNLQRVICYVSDVMYRATHWPVLTGISGGLTGGVLHRSGGAAEQ